MVFAYTVLDIWKVLKHYLQVISKWVYKLCQKLPNGSEEFYTGKIWPLSFVDVSFIHCEFASCVYVHEWKWICKVRIKYLKKDIAQCRHHG